MDASNIELAALAGDWLRRTNKFLVTAESCTGGLIGDWITDVAGSSDYYLGGVVAYSNQAKMAVLGVPPGMLAQYGAVSEETVVDMARGARKLLAAEVAEERTIGLSVSGIAGPGGGTPEKPVGLVYIGLSAVGFDRAYRFVWLEDRLGNKRRSAREALLLLVEYLMGNPRESHV